MVLWLIAEDWHSSIIDSEEERRMQVFPILSPRLFSEKNSSEIWRIILPLNLLLSGGLSQSFIDYSHMTSLDLYLRIYISFTAWKYCCEGFYLHDKSTGMFALCWIFESPSGLLAYCWLYQSTYITVMEEIKFPEHVLRISEFK